MDLPIPLFTECPIKMVNKMYKNSIIWWSNIPPEIKFQIFGIAVFIILISIFTVRSKLKKIRREAFLFNNGYHSVNPRTNELVFPEVNFRKNKIILKNCIRKTVDQIRDEKSLWEQTFHRKINGRKISEIRADGLKIVMALI